MRLVSEFNQFCRHLLQSRKLLITLSIDNFKQEYFGSYLGLIWAFIRPTVFILVIWFVFEFGFKAPPATNGAPFVLWLSIGFSAWFFFAEAMSSGVGSVTTKNYLLKKVDFRVSILPVAQVIAALFIHFIFLGIVVCIFFLNGYTPTIYWLQLPFYTVSLFTLLLGLTWLTSSLSVFIKDIGYLVGLILQVGFWATPVFWSIELVPVKYQFLLKINPMFFIIAGYRDSLINNVWFWQKGQDILILWIINITVCVAGAITFKRLRPHFGDVM